VAGQSWGAGASFSPDVHVMETSVTLFVMEMSVNL
jgi:hypothetical protein